MPIRPFVASDRAIWNVLWRDYQTFYKSSLTDEISAIIFDRLTSGIEPMGGFIAEDRAGNAVGFVHWVQHRTCWSISDNCYLQDLFVQPNVRGGGHGRALIQAVYAKAGTLGCARVYWQTQESNLQAQILYDKIAEKPGFIVYRKTIG